MTFGHRLARIGDLLGQPFMPWQRLVADVGCELLPNGRPAYREVIVTVPRQTGKTTLFVAWQIDRCLNWGTRQISVFTAQTGQDAREKWLDEIFPLIEESPLDRFVDKYSRKNGGEGLRFTNGSLLKILASSEGSGHSKTTNQAVMDEIWHDKDDRREQALRPAMITKPDAQLLVCSTAGTAASTLYNRKLRILSEAVQQDSGKGVAGFLWRSPDDWTVDQTDRLPEFHPAVGHTQEVETLAAEIQGMEPDEALRAYSNRPTQGASTLIPDDLWRRLVGMDAPGGRIRFGLEVAGDRESAAIVVSDGTTHEVVEHRPGTGWLVDRCNELTAKHSSWVAIDGGGPAQSLQHKLARCYVASNREVMQACGSMWDDMVEGRARFREHPSFDRARVGVVKKPIGDQFVWSRKASAEDVTPFTAAALAGWLASRAHQIRGDLVA